MLTVLALALSCAANPDSGARAPAPSEFAAPALSLALVLNVPAARLDVLENGAVTRAYRVAVGTPDHPTPIGTFRIARVEWNPWWIPPPFEWAAKERIAPPGPRSPVGRVKLLFATYMFLHGTAIESSLGSAASHGCVRLSNPDVIQLARLVHRYASPEVPEALLDDLENDTRRTISITLATPVPLTIEYRPVELREDRLEIHPDVYGRAGSLGEEARAVLAAAGWPADLIDGKRLDAIAREVTREGHSASVALADLQVEPRP